MKVEAQPNKSTYTANPSGSEVVKPVIHPHNTVPFLFQKANAPKTPDVGGARTKEDISRFERAVDAAVKSGPLKAKKPNQPTGRSGTASRKA